MNRPRTKYRAGIIVRSAVSCFLLAILSTGCGKSKQEEFPAAPATADASTAPTHNAGPAAANPAPAVDTRKMFNQVETAMKSKDYDKALDAAVALGQQQKQFTDAQSQAAHAQMVRLQGEIASAAASGDPKAKLAADKLRQMAGPK